MGHLPNLEEKNVKKIVFGGVVLGAVLHTAAVAYGVFVWNVVKKDKQEKLEQLENK